MKIDSIDVDNAIQNARQMLAQEQHLSPALRASLEMLILLVTVLLNRQGLNSRNSSKPPAADPDRLKTARQKSAQPSGGQKGHVGTTLQKVDQPDVIQTIKLDRRTLPKGKYHIVGFESRQVFDIDISRIVTEFQAQILENAQGQRFVAPFPDGVTKAVQYGDQLKAHVVYLSQYQLLPYQRIRDYFHDQLQIAISEGSVFNFNAQAFNQLAIFESISKDRLAASAVVHADETSININGTKHWLHCASNASWTHFYPHQKRGMAAMDAIDILPRFRGVLCHDHWKPYYRYDCQHSLCNAHHIRELTRAWEQDEQVWAKDMEVLLKTIKQAVDRGDGRLTTEKIAHYRRRYRVLLATAQIECPAPEVPQGERKRGRIKRSKSRNLLERLIEYEKDVLRFMVDSEVPFTNNRGENDIRMTKVQQKISGCFRSEQGARIFCRVRGYLSSCRKQNVNMAQALLFVFKGKLPDFALDDAE